MYRRLLGGAITVAVVMMCVAAYAQPQRGRRGAGRPGMGMRGGMSVQLLRNDAVQKDLGLSDEQISELREVASKGRPKFDREAIKNLSQEERQAKMKELREGMMKKLGELKENVDKILTEKQQKRLKQIELQMMGPMAFMRPDVAEKLQITDDQKEKMRDAFRALRQGREGGGPPDREKMAKEVREKLADILTDAQKSQLKEMRGEPFDVSQLRSRMGSGKRGSGKRGEGRKGPGGRKGKGRPNK